MRTYLNSLVLIIVAVNVLFASNEMAKVPIKVIAPTLSDSSAVHIAGNHDKLGN